MRVSVSADGLTGVAESLIASLRRRGHELLLHGALASAERGEIESGEWPGAGAGEQVGQGAGVGEEVGEGTGVGSGTRERSDWAWASEAAARDVAERRAEQAIVCCWTGTGASIAANKVRGTRAALCADAVTAAGARRWNDANVLALSLRATSQAQLEEILDAWFAGEPSIDAEDRANIAHVGEIDV
jgi:ribose 5-phosphate isomerase B